MSTPSSSPSIDEITTLHTSSIKGNIFDAPPHTLLVHACNTQGHWGAGMALSFAERYPAAYLVYKRHCDAFPSQNDKRLGLLGTALLIPPSGSNSHKDVSSEKAAVEKKDKVKIVEEAGVVSNAEDRILEEKNDGKETHFVGCLFTSLSYGKRKDSQKEILKNTELAVRDLINQVNEWNSKCGSSSKDGDGSMQMEKIERIWSCKINAGLFGVPWNKTLEVLENIVLLTKDKGEEADDNIIAISEIVIVSKD